MFTSAAQVTRALITYTDWWQPNTASVLQVGAARRGGNEHRDGFNGGLLDTLDERTELCHRMESIPRRDRQVLFLWYVSQLSVDQISRTLGISRRHCFRRRAAAVRMLVGAGSVEQRPGSEQPVIV